MPKRVELDLFRAASAAEPHAKPHNVQCACCPRTITLLTRTYLPEPMRHRGDVPLGTRDEFLEHHSYFGLSGYHEFLRGMLLLVNGSYGDPLIMLVLQSRKSPHFRDCYALPDFGLAVGEAIWVCPRCKGVFKGNPHNVEQYLFERQRSFRAGGKTFEPTTRSDV